MRIQGLSLIELLVVLSITAVLTVTALPGFANLVRKNQTRTVAEDLFHAIQLTREKAVSINRRVTIHKLNEWDQGWEVFVDNDGNGLHSENEFLLFQQKLSVPVRIKTNSPVRNYVSFTGSGESKTTTGAFLAGTLTICSEDKTQGFAIVIWRSGRSRIDKADAAACT